MGVAVEYDLHLAGTGILEKQAQQLLHCMAMAMGEVDIQTADSLHSDFLGTGGNTIPVTISRHLIKGDAGKFLFQSLGIIVVVAQMDHRIGENRFHTPAHKTQGTVGIRQNQNFHRNPLFSISSFIDYIIG
jgi:hypothetical protein